MCQDGNSKSEVLAEEPCEEASEHSLESEKMEEGPRVRLARRAGPQMSGDTLRITVRSSSGQGNPKAGCSTDWRGQKE